MLPLVGIEPGPLIHLPHISYLLFCNEHNNTFYVCKYHEI